MEINNLNFNEKGYSDPGKRPKQINHLYKKKLKNHKQKI